MKQLTLVRHAKSSWGHPGLADHDRPLNKRGEQDAPRMAAHLAASYPPPEAIISSTAVRALSTSKAMAAALGYPAGHVRHEEAIYEASTDSLWALVQGLDDKLQRVMLIGHNPGFTNLVNLLSDAGLENLPTCGVARIEFAVDHWSELRAGDGRLISLDRPKQFAD